MFIKATEEAAEREAAGAAKRLRTTILEEVKSYFRPELLNRFDEQASRGLGWFGLDFHCMH